MVLGADRSSASVPPASVSPLHWVKPPQQVRSQKTLVRLLDAAEDLILAEGVTALTVSEVTRRAGSSVGAFYARFADKDALLSTLHERSCEEALATAELALDPGRWGSAELGRVVNEIIRFTAMLCEQRLGLLLAFIASAATDLSYAERRATLEHRIAERLHAFLRSRESEVGHRDLATASKIAIRMILSTLEYGALIHRGSPKDPPSPVTAAELTRGILAYLGVPESGGRPRGEP